MTKLMKNNCCDCEFTYEDDECDDCEFENMQLIERSDS